LKVWGKKEEMRARLSIEQREDKSNRSFTMNEFLSHQGVKISGGGLGQSNLQRNGERGL